MDDQVIVWMLLIVVLIVSYLQQRRLDAHTEALRWFAQHIKIDERWRTEPMPAELAALMGEETEEREDY